MPIETDIFAGFDDDVVQEPTRAAEPTDIFAGMEEPDSATESAKRNLKLVVDRTPQAEVKVRKDAEQTNMPEQFTRANPDFNQTEQNKAIEDAPAGTTNLIAGNTTNAAIFKDKVKELSTIERLMTEDVTLGAAAKAAGLGLVAGVARTPEVVLDAYAIANEALKEEPFDVTTTFERGQIIADITTALEKHKTENMFDLRKLSQEGQDFLRSKLGDTKIEELLFQATETAGRMFGAAAVGGGDSILTLLSLGAGFKKTITEVEAGSPKHLALAAGMFSASVEYWTEKYALDILRKPGLKFFERLFKGLVADVPGELVATATEMWAIDQKILGKDAQPLESYIQALIDTALVATFTTVGTTTGVTALEKASKKLDVDQNRSQKVVDRLKLIKEEIDKSNIKQELGEQNMKVAIEAMVGDEDAYITDEGIASLFQTDNPEQIKQVSDIFTKLGIAPKEAMRQAQNGQDVIIKQADLLGLLTAEELEILSPHIKSDFADLSETQITEDVTADNKVILDESIAEIQAEEKAVQEEIKRVQTEKVKAQPELARISKEVTEARTAEEAETTTQTLESFSNFLTSQGEDATAFLKGLTFKRTPFLERAAARVKSLFQAPTEVDDELSFELANLEARINKLDPESKGAQKLIKKLRAQQAEINQELYDRAFEGFDTEETLFQRGTPITEPDNRIVFAYQNGLPEKIIHEGWERGNSARFELEGAGDILREYTKTTPDLGYIDEKLRRIDRTLTRLEERGKIHPDDHINKARNTDKRSLERLKEAYENQPTVSKEQESARQLLLAYINGNYKRVRQLHDVIKNETFGDLPLHLNKGDLAFFQATKGKADPKAAVDFTSDTATINLFEKADASSIPHELGHVFLRQMSAIEDNEGITDQFRTDMDSLRTWLGAEKGEGYTVAQQEQFARGWELYLREGKAPNDKLTGMFQRLQRWLTEVYKRALDLNVELTPEVRAVFDRMLNAETETQTAAAVNNMIEPTTERMNELGVPDSEQSDLKRLVRKAIGKAENALFRARNRAVRANKEQFEREAEKEVRAEDSQGRVFGVYEMIDDIKANGLQFSRQEYNEAEGNPRAYLFLPAKGITSTKDTAVSLDETAFAYGFDSADTMVEALSTTAPLGIAIQNRVNQKNAELEATFKSEDYLAETQEYADFIQRWNDHLRNEQARATRAEVTGKPRKKITTEQMKAYAQAQIDEMSVENAQRTDKFLNAMKRAATNMRKAEKAKDYAKAIRESEKMLLNKEMAAISVRNRRAVTAFENRAKKFRKLGAPKSVSLRYREGIRSLIERFSILPNVAPQNEDYSVADLQNLLQPPKSEKEEPYAVEFYASEFLIPSRPEDVRVRDYKKISMFELKELDNVMKFLTKMGRDEQMGLLSDGETQLQEVVDENVEEMNAIEPQKVYDRFSIARKLTDTSRKFFANLLGLPYITKALGGYQALKGKISSLETWITERLKDIEDDRLRRTDQNNQAIQEAVTVIGNAQRRMIKNAKGQKLFDSGVPVPEIIQDNGSQLNYWTPEQIMALAFNRGNQSNINAVTQGFEGLTLGQIDTLLNKYLTQQDMDAVQTILDQMESFFAETDRTHVKMKGFHMGKVPAQEWIFKGKKYRGGYYPLNYDRVLSDFIGEKKEIEDLFESEQAKFTVPFAASSHTITRTESGHALPVDLRLIHIYRHFDKTIRYITHAETIRDVDRIIRNKEWRKAAEKALGKDVYAQIRPSLKHIANPHIPGVDIPGKRAVGYLRSVATAANLALNTMVAMKQVFSTPSAIHDMGLGDGGGFKAYLKGMGHVMASPSVAYNTMLDMSPYMKERITSWERDLLRPKFNKMTPNQREVAFGNRHVTWDDVVNLGFFEIKAMDTATVLPIWWGAYQDKLNENSSNEKEAIRHADNIVRDTQPSATALDVSAWFRAGGFFSLFNLHQTFTVGKYGQRQRTYYRAFRDGKISAVDYAWFNFMDALIPLISINVMVAFLKGGDLAGDEEEWYDIAEKSISSWLFMGIPLVSSMYDAITKGWRDPLEVPGARQVKRTARTIGQMGQGVSNIVTGEELSGKEKEQLYWGMADMASDFSRVPVSKISKKALEGDGFREKIFGKQFKRRK
jgi:hypothetical protein